MEELEQRINLLEWTLLEVMKVSREFMPPAAQDAISHIGDEFDLAADRIAHEFPEESS